MAHMLQRNHITLIRVRSPLFDIIQGKAVGSDVSEHSRGKAALATPHDSS